MKITKFEHAFLQIELSAQQLLIDPGIYSPTLPKLENVVGVVLTHLHDDHSYLPHIAAIKQQFPNVRIFGPADVAIKLGEIDCEVVMHGSRIEVGEFSLDFFGDLHQEIHRSIPLVQNVGVLVNSKLYYPGDSYTQCEYSFELLACPSAAPWMKISDLIDYLDAVKPQRAFATHNAILSEHGHVLQNNRIREIVTKHGGEFSYLQVGESIAI
jgi:L-ascorbate metabolism protein UlaG (beta-lactamase superfamily)